MPAEPRRVEEVVIPVAEESISLSKHDVETGRVRVGLSTDVETVIVRETLRGNRIEVERVSVNKALPDGAPAPESRREGDTLIIPVLEERPVVIKRLFVTEEVRLRFVSRKLPLRKKFLCDGNRRRWTGSNRTTPRPFSNKLGERLYDAGHHCTFRYC